MSLAETQNRPLAEGPGALCLSPKQPPIAIATTACLLTLLGDGWMADRALATMLADGVSTIDGLVGLVTRVARTLGERWVADTCSFADVTLGLHRLTLLLFAIEQLPDPLRAPLHGGSILLAPAPGDQHGFGLATVAMALRRSGWDVTVDLSDESDSLVSRARRGFDCVGLSVGHDRAVPRAARLIERLRSAPRRPVVAVGGPMLLRDSDLALNVGADFSAPDGSAFVNHLQTLCTKRAA